MKRAPLQAPQLPEVEPGLWLLQAQNLRTLDCEAAFCAPRGRPCPTPPGLLPGTARPGAFCVPHSCRPLPPALLWSLRALFPAPSVGSLLPPRGLSLKPAMSTVQAAGRSGEGGLGRGGDGGGGGEGPLSFLRTPAPLRPPDPPVLQSQGCEVSSASLCGCRKTKLKGSLTE